jgi:hypothetical protein
MKLTPIKIDKSKHFASEWVKVYAFLKGQCPGKIQEIKAAVVNTVSNSLGEPMVNAACTKASYKLVLERMNSVLNDYGFMLEVECSNQETKYF